MRWLVMVVIAAGCAGADRRPPPPQHVPHEWHEVRASAGHTVHVVKNGVACRDCHGDDGFAAPPAELCQRCHPSR